MAKEGSTISGLMDSFATMTSMALQHGVPLQLLVDKFTHLRFEPSGFTKNREIPMAKSIMDYIFKWLAIKFLPRESQAEAGVILRDEPSLSGAPAAPPASSSNVTPPTPKDVAFLDALAQSAADSASSSTASRQPSAVTPVVGFIMPPKDADAPNIKTGAPIRFQQDAPSCSDCGSIMVRNGACYKCLNCGSTSGCS
jgi:ribonucleoside-diphosphate reductase alpha chain